MKFEKTSGYILGTVASVLRERDGEGAFLASKNKHYGIGSNPKMFRQLLMIKENEMES